MNSSEVVDWEQMQVLFGENPAELDPDMVDLYHDFLQDSQLQFQELQEAIETGESTAIARRAHKLKGSVSNFGFSATVTLLQRLESEVHLMPAAESKSIFDDTLAAFQKALETVSLSYPVLKAA